MKIKAIRDNKELFIGDIYKIFHDEDSGRLFVQNDMEDENTDDVVFEIIPEILCPKCGKIKSVRTYQKPFRGYCFDCNIVIKIKEKKYYQTEEVKDG